MDKDTIKSTADALKNIQQNGVGYNFKYDDTYYWFLIVLLLLFVGGVISSGYFKSKSNALSH